MQKRLQDAEDIIQHDNEDEQDGYSGVISARHCSCQLSGAGHSREVCPPRRRGSGKHVLRGPLSL